MSTTRCSGCVADNCATLFNGVCKCLCHERSVVYAQVLNDGRMACLYKQIFGWRILIGPRTDHIGGDEVYEYRDDDVYGESQMVSLIRTWDGYGHPAGWYRYRFKDNEVRRTDVAIRNDLIDRGFPARV